MIDESEYTIRLINELPDGVRGLVSPSPDGHFNIYINPRQSYAGFRDTARHELDHIENDDFYNGKSIYEVEGYKKKARGLLGIPGLMRARDLMPKPEPEPEPEPKKKAALSCYQKRLVLDCLKALDAECERWWMERCE